MAPFLLEVRNHTRRQIFVVAFNSASEPFKRLRRLHSADTPGWDYDSDDIRIRELARVVLTDSVAIFVAAYAKVRKAHGWRVLAASSLRVETARQGAGSSKERRPAPARAARARQAQRA